jgi:hypothetical protein
MSAFENIPIEAYIEYGHPASAEVPAQEAQEAQGSQETAAEVHAPINFQPITRIRLTNRSLRPRLQHRAEAIVRKALTLLESDAVLKDDDFRSDIDEVTLWCRQSYVILNQPRSEFIQDSIDSNLYREGQKIDKKLHRICNATRNRELKKLMASHGRA